MKYVKKLVTFCFILYLTQIFGDFYGWFIISTQLFRLFGIQLKQLDTVAALKTQKNESCMPVAPRQGFSGTR